MDLTSHHFLPCRSVRAPVAGITKERTDMEDLGEVTLTDNVGNLVGTAHGTLVGDRVCLTDWGIKPVNLFDEAAYMLSSSNRSWRQVSFCGWDTNNDEASFDVSRAMAA
jgi:hypothetical protein